ncbi:unnamed protein product [Spirodela intermedia]|uniref:Uncharacterized protein n=1 Tax=Spirodela intermedia TaxID=51605 RepID=A0A7I8INN7_SPIIN|nr:unnamed protein product [Spirodela intermedia]CAA6659567.1 unnamed protein product [Spirodela intermedia]
MYLRVSRTSTFVLNFSQNFDYLERKK